MIPREKALASQHEEHISVVVFFQQSTLPNTDMVQGFYPCRAFAAPWRKTQSERR